MCKRLYTQEEQRTIRDFKHLHKYDKCHYCGKPLTDTSMTVDHLLPYSRGGETVPDNLVMACKKCNTDKSDLTEIEYINYLRKKKEFILNDKTINKIKIMITANEGIGIEHLKTLSELRNKQQEKNEIERCICDLNFSAADGYKLAKELKECFIAIRELSRKSNKLLRLKNAIQESNDKLKIVYDEMVNGDCKDLRSKMDLGHLGDARKIG